MHAKAVTVVSSPSPKPGVAQGGARALRSFGCFVVPIILVVFVVLSGRETISGQSDPSDADLERASGGRTVALGSASSGRRVSTVPLEVYVARVLAGEW